MRLIDGDKLQEFPIRANRCDKEHANTHFLNGIETVLEYAEQLPTVDAVIVTWCKDCKYRTEFGNCGHPRQHGILPTAYPSDYCSYGERKDGNNDA